MIRILLRASRYLFDSSMSKKQTNQGKITKYFSSVGDDVKATSSTSLHKHKTTKEKFTFFYSNNHPFSQWHKVDFEVDGKRYCCAEQYMMYQKAVLFKDEDHGKKIMNTDDPKEQKKLGRKVQNFDPKVWGKNCLEIVKKGNLGKFSQNPSLRKHLFETAGTTIVEAAPRDRVWGIGLGAKNSKAQNRATWRGKNLLGQVLTEVRDILMAEYETKHPAKNEDGSSSSTGEQKVAQNELTTSETSLKQEIVLKRSPIKREHSESENLHRKKSKIL